MTIPFLSSAADAAENLGKAVIETVTGPKGYGPSPLAVLSGRVDHNDTALAGLPHIRSDVDALVARMDAIEHDIRTVLADLAIIRTAQEEAYRVAHTDHVDSP